MTAQDPRPYLVVTVLLDPSARAAAITRSHGDAVERAQAACDGESIAGLDIAELNISPKAFSYLRKNLSMPPGTCALYDIFPVASHLPSEHRKIAGQFLAAEALWNFEEQGLTSGAPTVERFTLPDGWSKDPKEIRDKLVEVGALDLAAEAVQTFVSVKSKWDATTPAIDPFSMPVHDDGHETHQDESAETAEAAAPAPATEAAAPAPTAEAAAPASDAEAAVASDAAPTAETTAAPAAPAAPAASEDEPPQST